MAVYKEEPPLAQKVFPELPAARVPRVRPGDHATASARIAPCEPSQNVARQLKVGELVLRQDGIVPHLWRRE